MQDNTYEDLKWRFYVGKSDSLVLEIKAWEDFRNTLFLKIKEYSGEMLKSPAFEIGGVIRSTLINKSIYKGGINQEQAFKELLKKYQEKNLIPVNQITKNNLDWVINYLNRNYIFKVNAKDTFPNP